ncbi:TonB-dependent receptor [Sandarakinorhabdus glacialis]|nr:TonB-dependent receptor [Polymorphobacter glacialis]
MSQYRAGLIGGVSLLGLFAAPLSAQTAGSTPAPAGAPSAALAGPANTGPVPVASTGGSLEEIVVTAQRTAQSLQDVPIALTAFSAEALQKQQINNTSDLQLTLPNITFTQTNFGSPSFTIRGIGNLCVGTTCDAATGIALNEMPLLGTRLFETEFYDLERVEVLRGPQGTLYGRNATSGVINFITAKPDSSGIHAAGEGEYGNYNSIKVKGMINMPLTDTLAVRLAGVYLNRDGFTNNTYDDTSFDNRNLYSFRGSVRWEPTDNTTVDLMGYYFHEKDNRARIQKQLCDTDPTGVLGCLPGQLRNGITNGNSTLGSILTSKQFLALNGFGPAAGLLALNNLNGTSNMFTGEVNPADLRTVNTGYEPQFQSEEQQYMARVRHDFGSITAQVSGMYQKNSTRSQQDYNSQASNPKAYVAGLTGLQFLANNGVPSLKPVANLLIPNGPNGPYCSSQPEPNNSGIFGAAGNGICASVPLGFDRSSGGSRSFTGEGIITSNFDSKFNFLLGGIYIDTKANDVAYYVNTFALDYAAGVLGSIGGTPAFLAAPFFRSNTPEYRLKSYGLFGEAYFEVNDRLKFTAGLRYNNDDKSVTARTTLFNCPNAIGTAVANLGCADFDQNTPGKQDFARQKVKFSEFTGRFVVDYKITDENLLYAFYSRGYKSGGINPPLSPNSSIPTNFSPEFVDAFEVGSKNTFLDGTFRANLTAFYYKYKGLQLSSIQERTSVNQNINATIYGVEGEFIIQPTREFTVNLNASYLHTAVADDTFLINPADPSGGRDDVVIIKDITNAANCAVVPNVRGNSALANGYVAAVNSGINAATGTDLRSPVAFPSGHGIPTGVTGAYSICNSLAASAAAAGVSVAYNGVRTNVKDNNVPQAPTYKFSAGAQYVIELASGLSVTPRLDLAFTGESYGSIHNTFINRVPSYTVVNGQIQVNGNNDRWYARAFVQNLFANNAITGLYVTDQSSGLFSNIFTLEPRRYGGAIGFRF